MTYPPPYTPNSGGWDRSPQHPTAPLPPVAPPSQYYGYEPPPPPKRGWGAWKIVLVSVGGVAAALVLIGTLGAIFAPSDDSKPKSATGELASSSAVTTSVAAAPSIVAQTSSAAPTPSPNPTPPKTSAGPSSAAPTVVAPAPAAPTSWTMPNEVGRVLQTAQDDIQRVTGNPLFVTHSTDARGSRSQVLDSNWKVCGQNIRAGQQFDSSTRITFSAVKLSETCP
jgi:hypothetical protein